MKSFDDIDYRFQSFTRPNEHTMPTWCQAKITDKKIWTDGLFTITIESPDVQNFEAGQFLQLGVYKEGREGDEDGIINRPYSVASPHGNQLQFFIVVVPEGELTPKLDALKVGDPILVNDKATGRFTLGKTPDADHLWLISTGTGLAPYIAMLRTEEPWQRFKKVVVVHGVRHASDLAYTEELNSYKEKYPGKFELVQSLTREQSDTTLRGRIPALLASGQLEKAADCELSATTSSVLLCGNPAMLDSMEDLLNNRDMIKHRSKAPGQIVLERYW
jgi:ferredoxin--NADP+ reductase